MLESVGPAIPLNNHRKEYPCQKAPIPLCATMTVPETPVAIDGTAASRRVAIASKGRIRRIMPH